MVKATLAVSAGTLAQAALAEPNLDDTFIGQAAEPASLIEDSLVLPEVEPDINLGLPDEAVAVDDVMSLDFDLGTTNVEPIRPSVAEPVPEAEFVSTIGTGDANALDFDLGVDSDPLAVTADASPEPLETDIIDFDLGSATNVRSILAEEEGPDFSPEGTMVMRPMDALTSTFVGNETQVVPDNDFDEKSSLAEDLAMSEMVSTFVGNETLDASSNDSAVEALGDFELDMNAGQSSATVVNPDVMRMAVGDVDEAMLGSLSAEPAPSPVIDDEESLDFDVRLTDSSVLGQPMHVPSYDIGSINLDLSSDDPVQSVPVLNSDFAKPAPVEAESPAPAVAEISDALREEVSTKLDLAKAYEEMGDLEGARELLQEVALEGSPDLVEQAREILGRIGE